jgi:rare lipoprotein A
MVFRSSAAICGAVITLAISVAMARSEIGAVHSNAVDNAASGAAIVGAASMYNPYRPGWREGGLNTASGERYDPSAWAAAIKTSLRKKFGGVRHGASPKYALVEAAGKKAIVKINDVGPLTPGRIIDFNERTMRHFDPSLSGSSLWRKGYTTFRRRLDPRTNCLGVIAGESCCRSTALLGRWDPRWLPPRALPS